ncbi:MAG TPA: SRPBCC family protein [Edaphobacter sp.]|nr:SRPBCC family protein [Edaphobacter sp.]
MRHHFQSEQWVPFPIEHVFLFFADPENLPRLMPRWQRARIEKMTLVPPPSASAADPLLAGAGSRITLSFRAFPFPPIRLRWTAEIADFVWNDHFSDLQTRGPFAYWLHRHTVESATREDPSGRFLQGTLIRDDVTYQIPFEPLGGIAAPFMKGQLHSIFAYRQTQAMNLLSESYPND